MTRQENTFERSLEFSGWIRQNCNDAGTGFTVFNLDFVFWDFRRRRLILIEEKTHGTHETQCAPYVRRFMREVMEPALRDYCATLTPAITFIGFHTLVFENTSPDDGRMWLNGREINAEFLGLFLNGGPKL